MFWYKNKLLIKSVIVYSTYFYSEYYVLTISEVTVPPILLNFYYLG